MTLQPSEIDRESAQRLAAAVVAAAMVDALQGSPEAIYWLYSVAAAFYAALAGRDNIRPLVRAARKCQPGRRLIFGRTNAANIGQALAR